jgi:hypothetical protein
MRHPTAHIVLPAVALLAFAPSALAQTKPKPCHPSDCVAKGTPYAAEVTMTADQTIDASVTDNTTFEGDCNAGDHYDTAVQSLSGTWSWNWHVIYPHVTVPVASRAELGAAYKKLHVQPTPTSDGSGGITDGSYAVSGSGTADPANSCEVKPFQGSGTIASVGRPTFFQQDEANASVFQLVYADDINGSPLTYQDETGQSHDAMNDLVDYWDAANPDSSQFAESLYQGISLEDVGAFDELVHNSDAVLKGNGGRQGQDCGTSDDGTVARSCSFDDGFTWSIDFHKIRLYKTKRNYRR